MTTTKLIIFAISTILIIIFSWFVSLREKRYHGIPRFFVFEGLLLLGLMQADVWFTDPLAPEQLVSWLLFLVSIYYAFGGIIIFIRKGKPAGNFENTTRLVTTGLYKYIRHPMYASLLFLGWGMFLKDISILSFTVITFTSLSVYITCKTEEKEMISKFGAEYLQYMKKTRLFVPYVI